MALISRREMLMDGTEDSAWEQVRGPGHQLLLPMQVSTWASWGAEPVRWLRARLERSERLQPGRDGNRHQL